MRKLIAAINMSLDGFCDHTEMSADDETHQHYNDLLANAGLLIYGRVTYQLMEDYWPLIVKAPTGNKPTDDFAVLIDNIPKIVYSRTLTNVNWHSTTLKTMIDPQEIIALKKQSGKDILVGSPSLITACTELQLVDEYQLCIHPTILGKGLPLFRNLRSRTDLKFIKSKSFACGAVVMYYERH